MTTTEGRYIVARHWHRWAVLDQSWNPPRDLPGRYDTQAEAHAAADQLNTPQPPRPHPQQPSLFDTQEV